MKMINCRWYGILYHNEREQHSKLVDTICHTTENIIFENMSKVFISVCNRLRDGDYDYKEEDVVWDLDNTNIYNLYDLINYVVTLYRGQFNYGHLNVLCDTNDTDEILELRREYIDKIQDIYLLVTFNLKLISNLSIILSLLNNDVDLKKDRNLTRFKKYIECLHHIHHDGSKRNQKIFKKLMGLIDYNRKFFYDNFIPYLEKTSYVVRSLNNDFGTQKNKLNEQIYNSIENFIKEYYNSQTIKKFNCITYNLDSDENFEVKEWLELDKFVKLLPSDTVNWVLNIPRKNTLTFQNEEEEKIFTKLISEKVGGFNFNLSKEGYINYPDSQMRVYNIKKDKDNIKPHWKNKVHEILTNYDIVKNVNYHILHQKSFNQQFKQNYKYFTIWKSERSKLLFKDIPQPNKKDKSKIETNIKHINKLVGGNNNNVVLNVKDTSNSSLIELINLCNMFIDNPTSCGFKGIIIYTQNINVYKTLTHFLHNNITIYYMKLCNLNEKCGFSIKDDIYYSNPIWLDNSNVGCVLNV